MPDIARWATFETSYGTLRLTGADARKSAALVDKLLQRKLKQAERIAAQGR